MIYRLRDMIYGLRRIIYLLRKCDIISVPQYAAGIYHPLKVDIISKIYHPFRKERILLKKSLLSEDKRDFFMVPVVGVEPTRYRYHWILSPARLPIPSHRRNITNDIITKSDTKVNSFFYFLKKCFKKPGGHFKGIRQFFSLPS